MNKVSSPPLLFSCSVVSHSLRPHGLYHTRLPSPSPSPTACSNSYPLSWWCHATISSSVAPFSSCLQSFPVSGIFQRVNSLYQSIVNKSIVTLWPKYWSFSISTSNEYLGLISFRIDWLDLLAVQGTLKSLLKHHSLKITKVKIELLFWKRGQLSHCTCSVNNINIC